jgi:hypothetical protein
MELTEQIDKGFCEIRIRGELEARWADWFDLMEVSSEDKVTVVSGIIPDQAALQGLMEKISMLGMTIISIDFRSTNLNGDHHDIIPVSGDKQG